MWVKENKWLLAALITGGMIRAVFLFFFYPDLNTDPDAYKQIAENVCNQGVFGQVFASQMQPTAYRPPLYPCLLSLLVTPDPLGVGVVSIGYVAAFHFALGLLTLWFAFQLACRFGFEGPRCFGVAIIVAMDPIALRHSSLVMTETLAIFFATIGLWLLSCGTNGRRLPFLLGGVVFGLFGLCRPTFLIWAGLIGLAVMLGLLSRPRESKRKNLLNSVLFFSGILCILAPWIARNHQLYGRLILATTHGGYTLFLGNNDSFYDYLRSGKRSPWNGENELQETVKKIRKDCQFFSEEWQGVIVDEVKKDRLYYDKAIEVIRRRPLDFCYACLIRAVRFWCIIPNSSDLESPGQTVIRLGAGIWYGILFAFVWVGAFQWIQCFVRNPVNRWFLFQKSLPAILLIIAFQGLHLVYWSNMRMRAPLVVVLALLAVLGTVKGVAVCQTPGALGENENKPRK